MIFSVTDSCAYGSDGTLLESPLDILTENDCEARDEEFDNQSNIDFCLLSREELG